MVRYTLGVSETSSAPKPLPPPETFSQKSYERRFSFLQRLFKVLFSPKEGMEDVALAPSYGEIFGILVIQMIVMLMVIALAFSKIQFMGLSFLPAFWSILMFAIVIAVVFAYGLLIAIWLIESVIVKFACSRGSSWDLKPAASITGYTFLVDIVLSIVGAAVLWPFIPWITIDITNLELAQQTIAALRSQLNWLRLCQLPFSFLGIAWKSYLGGLGANFGTGGRCSRKLGFAVFFCLGLVSLPISYIMQQF